MYSPQEEAARLARTLGAFKRDAAPARTARSQEKAQMAYAEEAWKAF